MVEVNTLIKGMLLAQGSLNIVMNVFLLHRLKYIVLTWHRPISQKGKELFYW